MDAEELKALEVARTVDARGTDCPGPLLEAKRGIAGIPVGGVMEVLSTDEGTTEDIPIWADKVGHEHLGDIKESSYWRIFVKRGK